VSQARTGEALACCERIRDLILMHPGGPADGTSLAQFRRLCAVAVEAAGDARCSELLGGADAYAVDLFSVSGCHKWTRGSRSGAEILKLCILGKMSALRERLLVLYPCEE
jgi:hypothetical protein